MDPEFAPEQELRIALVLYGGVSLAIYMYGVVEELHHLVRSTAPEESYADDGEPPGGLHVDEPTGTEAVYRKLGRLLPARADDEPLADEGPVRTRFVVDIISGTSAGGINGICLAKALVNEAPLAGLKDVWLDEGGIASLVNDCESTYRRTPDGGLGDKIEGLPYRTPPESLLSGARMTDTLVSALRGMNRDPEEPRSPSRLVDELDLWVTATDLVGLDVPIRIANATMTEKRHANRYRFRYPAGDDGDNDFGPQTDLFMAYAARSTSAFPFAFDPAILEDLERYATSDEWPAFTRCWQRFHPEYASPSDRFEQRSFSDGGILDNKPFSYATDSLVARRATVPVNRHLVYVEPDPAAAVGSDAHHKEEWNAFETAQAAVAGIPRLETIRDDLQLVLARNREIARARDVISRMDLAPVQVERLTGPTEADDWAAKKLTDILERPEWGPSYGVYHRLKVDGVIDWLASVLARARGFDSNSDHALAVQYLARVWKESRYEADGEKGHTDNAFLLAFDVPYRVRRIDFVLEKLRELVGSDSRRAEHLMETAGVGGGPIEPGRERDRAVRTLRLGLEDARQMLTDFEAAVVAGNADDEVASAIAGIGITGADLDRVLDAASHLGMLEQAGAVVSAQAGAFDALADALEGQLDQVANDARERVDQTLQPGEAEMTRLAQALRFFYDTYEAYDLAVYPLQFGSELGETNPVKVIRISPLDADGPGDGIRPDLKGIQLGHFGAFLERRWRREDMVWGRLDAAETLIGTLLGENHSRRRELVEEAHGAIIREYAEESGIDPDQAPEWFARKDRVPEHPERAPTHEALERAQVVIGEIVEDVLTKRAGPADAEKVRGVVRPVAGAILAGGSRGAVLRALLETALQNRGVFWGVGVWGALVLAFVALTAFGADIGWALLTLFVAPVALGLVGLYFAVGRIRKAIAKGIDKVVYKDEIRVQPEHGLPEARAHGEGRSRP